MLSDNNILFILSIILTQMFFVSGIDKCLNFSKVVKGFEQRFPITMPSSFHQIAIVVAILIELIAPSILAYSIYVEKYHYQASIACISLIIFTIAATLIYHFPPTKYRYYPFMSNVTTVGGLSLMIWILSSLKK